MTALAESVGTGRLEDLEVLLLNDNWDITDAGSCALARRGYHACFDSGRKDSDMSRIEGWEP